MKNLKSIAYPIRDIKDMPWKQEYEECGTRMTHPYSAEMSELKISKNLCKLVNKLVQVEMHTDKKEGKDIAQQPHIIYRNAASMLFTNKLKPYSIVLFNDNGEHNIEIYTKSKGKVVVMRTTCDEPKDFISSAVKSIKGIQQEYVQEIWNLGEDSRLWPQVITDITLEHHTAEFKAWTAVGPDITIEQGTEITKNELAKASEKLEALGVSMEMFTHTYLSVIRLLHTSSNMEEFNAGLDKHIADFQHLRVEGDLAKAA